MVPTDMEALLMAIANIGVGATISLYLVYWITKKLNGKIERLANALEELNRNIERLQYLIEHRNGGSHG